MRKRRDAHLKRDAGEAAENFIHVQYFFHDRFGITDQQRASRSAYSIELRARCRRPSAFLADLRESVGISREKIVGGLFGCISEEPDRMKAHDQFFGSVPGAAAGLAVKIN